MALPAGTTVINGFALTPDGALYVTLGGGTAGAAGALSVARAISVAAILAKSGVAVTGAADTVENALATITVPAGAMGLNGALRIKFHFTSTNSAGTKAWRVRFSTITGTIYFTTTITTQLGGQVEVLIANRNSASSQTGGGFAALTTASLACTAETTSAVDTTASSTIIISAQKNTGGDTVTLEQYTVELLSDGT